MSRPDDRANAPLEEIEQVAERTAACDYRIWGFGVGPALLGLLRAGRRTGRQDLVGRVRALVEPALDRPPDPTDHLICVEVLIELARLRPELRIAGSCERWRRAVVEAARPYPDRPPVHRPDADWPNTIWVDCLHTDGPGLVALGETAAAVRQVEESCAALQRPDGLFDHGYDVAAGRGNGVAWGRGQGWALLGLVGTLRGAPDRRLAARLRRLVEAMAHHERNGRWRTIVDDPSAPWEDSTSAMTALAVRSAITAGVLPASYAGLAGRAYARAAAAVSGGGLVVSEATPVGPPDVYRTRAEGIHPWGQGPLLLAMLEGTE
jgi:rhamnogalacturonyl hydrolase YesR